MSTQTQTRYKSSINVKCETWEEQAREIQRFCDANSQPGVIVLVSNLPYSYAIEIKLYNSNTKQSKIIYLTRYNMSVIITPKFDGGVIPDSTTWKHFGWQNREVFIAVTIEVFSKSTK